MKFNVFHILGDVSHTTSKLILIWAIHSNSSAEGKPTPPSPPASPPTVLTMLRQVSRSSPRSSTP